VTRSRDIVITRSFDAPCAPLWRAWTDPQHVAQWWGPEGFTTHVEELELREGGVWRYVMVGEDGAEYPVSGVFREVVPQRRIVTTDEFDEGYPDEDADLPRGLVVTCEFEARAGRAQLTLRIAHPTEEDRRKHEEMGVVAGWNSSLDCLEEHLDRMQASGA